MHNFLSFCLSLCYGFVLVLLFVFGILGFVGTESSITISNNVLVF